MLSEAKKIYQGGIDTFYQYKWPYWLTQLSTAVKLTDDEYKKLEHNKTAQLIAFIVHLSDCENVDRIALSQLSIYVIANRSCIFQHNNNDNIANRIRLLCYFPGGNNEIKKAGYILLQLISLNDHKRDYVIDQRNGDFNPLHKQIDFKSENKKLWDEYNQINPVIRNQFESFTEFIPFSWWYV